jgi:hypothetical protein
MDKPNYTIRVLIFVVPLGVALVALLLLLKGLAAPLPTPAPFTPTPDPAQEVMARVGEQRITFADWTVAFYLDVLMSRLSGQPVPAARDTLDRLVNDALILSASAGEGIAASEADVQARIVLLETNWGLTDEQVADELAVFGLNRGVWAEAIARLLTVERYLAEVIWADVPAEGQADALAAWLQTHGAQANVDIDTRGLQPALPELMPLPTATSLAFSPPATNTALPFPTATNTLVVASPLATPSLAHTPVPTATPLAASPLATPMPPPSPMPTSPRPPAVGQPAPDFALIDADDRPVSLSDYRGQSRVVILFFRTTG